MAVKRLIHLNVVCSDFERSLRFYEDVVGAKVAMPFEKAADGDDFLGAMGIPGGSGHRGAMLYLGDERRGPYIDLIEWDVKGQSDSRGARDLGVPRLAILVDDVDASFEEVKAKGVVPMGEPITIGTGHYQVRCFMFPDPDGFLVEFAQFVRP